jgi:hypothetical protein
VLFFIFSVVGDSESLLDEFINFKNHPAQSCLWSHRVYCRLALGRTINRPAIRRMYTSLYNRFRKGKGKSKRRVPFNHHEIGARPLPTSDTLEVVLHTHTRVARTTCMWQPIYGNVVNPFLDYTPTKFCLKRILLFN